MKVSKATATAVLLSLPLAAGVLLAQNPPSQAPVFKSKVEVVQLDVSVLDKNRQPVRGLGREDFTVFEDGKPQPVVAFSAFDIDDDAAPVTGWMRDVPPDVTNNELKDSRLFVLVMDDALIPQDPWMIQASKKIAESIIDKLGPNDLTSVVFTGDNRKSQDFTNDRTKLRAALDKFNPGLAGYKFGSESNGVEVDDWFHLSAIRTLSTLCDFLAAAPTRRKAVFWVSPGVPMDAQSDPITYRILREKTQAMFDRAQIANVTIYPIDPTGLGGLLPYLMGRVKGNDPLEVEALVKRKVTAMNDYVAATAANSGGRVVMNTNNFEPGIQEIFDENKSYYLIGYEPTNAVADGKRRHLDVKVDRPGVEVRSRSSYDAPKPEKPSKNKAALSPEAAELGKAIGGLLPMGDLPLKVMTAPFAVPGQRLSAVAVVLGIQQPVPAAAASARITETTELQISAFTPEGDPRGTQRHTAKVAIRQGADGMATYEILGRIDLPAGRYRLRIAATNSTSARTGSVFTDVIVPDYSNVPFSMSPVAVGATPGRAAAPKDFLAPLLPFTPTAEREFATTDKVETFLRLYQSGQKPVDQVSVVMRVLDIDSQVKASETRVIGVDQFTVARDDAQAPLGPTTGMIRGTIAANPQGDRFANLALRIANVPYLLPISTLTPGAYLLTVEAVLGTTTIRRDVRFSVR